MEYSVNGDVHWAELYVRLILFLQGEFEEKA
jgi:hypothetical protein